MHFLTVIRLSRQWAHTFLSIKFVYYAVALDEPAESAYAFVFCLLYSLCVLDRFKNPDGLGSLECFHLDPQKSITQCASDWSLDKMRVCVCVSLSLCEI
jgi:hypothetical protein